MPIPPQIEPIWTHVQDEAVMVHAYWQTFNELFRQPRETIDLLERSAGFFFSVVRDALATDIQLTLSKLSDPARQRQGTFENATIPYLLLSVQSLGIDALHATLEPLCAAFVDACAPIRESRNKRIAHFDLNVALHQGTPLADVKVEHIRNALAALTVFLNAIDAYFNDAEAAYDSFSTQGQGAEDLIWLLKMAERYQALQQEDVIPFDDPRQNWPEQQPPTTSGAEAARRPLRARRE